MENNVFDDNVLSLEETNTPEQLDAFEVQYLQGLNPRWIFDLSRPIGPEIDVINDLYNTDTNFQLDQGEVDPFDAENNGLLYRYVLENAVYWQDGGRWIGPNQPPDAQVFFRNHIAIRNGFSDANIGYPSRSYGDTPTTAFQQPYMIDGDLNDLGGGDAETKRINPPRKPIVLSQVPVINKDLAMYVPQNAVSAFRSGYFEFSIKTDNPNCIIFQGDVGTEKPDTITTVDKDTIVTNKTRHDAAYMSVEIKNGKLLFNYDDYSVDNSQSFEILSNQTVSDNEWHHIVINFNKKGTLKRNRKKVDKRLLEIWIDAKLDVVDNEILNKKQFFIPQATWFFVDSRLTALPSTAINPWNSYDSESVINISSGFQRRLGTEFVGSKESDLNFVNGVWNSLGDNVAFTGLFYTFVCGFNEPLSYKEIQFRHSLFFNEKLIPAKTSKARAILVSPTINVNKKKALKLFWNNVDFKNGIELDSNYQVETISVSHKNKISKTETYNIDIANNKEIKYLSDIKAVFTDSINIFGPGKYFNLSDRKLQQNPVGTAWDGISKMVNSASYEDLEALKWPDYIPGLYTQNRNYNEYSLSDGAMFDMPFSGITLVDGDRILLTNQIRQKDNGIYIFNGYNKILTRAEDANSPSKLNNAVVRVVDGIYKDTSWVLENNISSISDAQIWVKLQSHPTAENFNTQPIFTGRWSNENGTTRLIDLEQDINIANYDLIVFMNYPESNEEIKNNFDDLSDIEITATYKKFIKSLQNVTSNGASLYVSSPKLAEDLGIVKTFTYIDQFTESSDLQAATISPFEVNEPANKYFDTHRNNRYEVATPVAGLTNKTTYILTDFINYIPENTYDYEQYHAKYSYRQFGLQEGNEFFIPGLALRRTNLNENLPGFVENQKRANPLAVVKPSDIITGTVVTKLANTYYTGSTVTNNPYDDYASTIIVHNGQILAGQPTNGKIFVNCVEDAYTFSRYEYNKAVIQVIPTVDTNESIATRAWQYSTSRLDREPAIFNISELTELGQTTPTNGGGGPLIQAPTNSSNGIIRSENDRGNNDYQSDLYPKETEERYPLQEIPTLSMTWLGLEWLSE